MQVVYSISNKGAVSLIFARKCYIDRKLIVTFDVVIIIFVGAMKAETDELNLKDGESYFVIVRATNKLGFTYSLRSDGLTVQLEPLLPGNVRDGDIAGVDLNLQLSVTTLSANWDGFGQPKSASNGPLIRRT